ncbi:hypothetical protein M2277_002644 [Paenibacillus sp. LBL]|uniref:hypothetical protein n=1 Tax=Paenibacillus sp. LBL TaxID=2940563 RepID=UPI002473A719|nr:hypothetical protein [Paenibacillus sp. LBL]MDH6671982.1 hypothetical protein [Paenibacillus sp. LBL]
MATIGQALTAPESGWKRMNADHPLVLYTGAWTTQSNAAFSGGINKYSNSVGNTISFTFIGTKFRYIGQYNTTSKTPASISIDGVTDQIHFLSNTLVNSVLIYEKTGLVEGKHTVVITINAANEYQSLQGIDIDFTGRFIHPNEVLEIKDLDIGNRIRCNYSATVGVAGTFKGLGQETTGFIPVAGTATPNGDFYFIMVEDTNKRKILIADRNIQYTISWDALNGAGFASGSGIPFNITPGPIGYSFAIRLLSGGVESTDKDNEWDEHIVNSTLNGTIVSGDNAVWNWSGNSFAWTSTTLKGNSSNRTVRGNSAVATWTSSDAILSNGGGFRPVLEIIMLPMVNSLILSGGEYKKYKPGKPLTPDIVQETIPAMTSNTAPNGLAFASSQFSDSYAAWYAFNKKDDYEGWAMRTGSTSYLGYGFTIPKTIIKYAVRSGTLLTELPKSWTLSGSNDSTNGADGTWNLLDSQTGQTWTTNYTDKDYTVKTPGSYKFFRINITENNGNTAYIGINELKLYELVRPGSPAIPSSWETVSSTLPNVDTFISEGMDDLSILERKLTTFEIPMNGNTASGEVLGVGRMFKERIDLNKYIDIKIINVK